MKKENDSIEDFQDLFLRGSAERRTELGAALQQHVKAPWRHAKDREQKIAEDSGNGNVILFERESTNGSAASLLILSKRRILSTYRISLPSGDQDTPASL